LKALFRIAGSRVEKEQEVSLSEHLPVLVLCFTANNLKEKEGGRGVVVRMRRHEDRRKRSGRVLVVVEERSRSRKGF